MFEKSKIFKFFEHVQVSPPYFEDESSGLLKKITSSYNNLFESDCARKKQAALLINPPIFIENFFHMFEIFILFLVVMRGLNLRFKEGQNFKLVSKRKSQKHVLQSSNYNGK